MIINNNIITDLKINSIEDAFKFKPFNEWDSVFYDTVVANAILD